MDFSVADLRSAAKRATSIKQGLRYLGPKGSGRKIFGGSVPV